MKISCLVHLVMSGALTLALSNAVASNAAPQQSGAATNTPGEHPTVASSSDIANHRQAPCELANAESSREMQKGIT